MNLPVLITAGNLPLNYEALANPLFQAIRSRMRGFARGDSILTGNTTFTTAPVSNIGPWFDGSKWNFWSDTESAYIPEVRKLDGPNADVNATVVANPTAARLVYLSDKSGTILLVNDIYVPRAAVILTAFPFTIDWTRSSDFICRLQHNTIFYMSGSREGQRISVFVQNDGTNFIIDWPDFIQWPGGIEPPMPASQAGQNHMAEFKFVNLNGIIYGELYSTAIHANPANTVFVGGSDTDAGKEVTLGFHAGSGPTLYPSKIE